ncbi:MAG: hypothetical protein RLZZ59_640 [Pseudomonadota bacterium]|jgi:protein SCO1/2
MKKKMPERKLKKDTVHKIDEIKSNEKSENDKSSDSFIRVLIVISMIIATVAVYFLMTNSGATRAGIRDDYYSTWANVGGTFSLVDVNGKSFSSSQLRGRPNLIYFGFTFCPDICPTELQKISKVMDMLAKYNFEITPVFITIDPTRDTSSLLKGYLKSFNSQIIGLTGTTEQIEKVAKMYNVYYEKSAETANDEKNYLLNHTAYIYLMDQYGKFVKLFDISANAEEIVDFIHTHFIQSGFSR